ncbi:MAG: hypothetical protein COT85_01445 [Chlamydiae bacterium CG10_big_fil_rev_8_21_14_0_10_42_34]|nr:MAG: hypothetical protein COT85_01445 [Chlamydiae bacterium CG10_big_fil_rev_8_21_14_0_10_42_34]
MASISNVAHVYSGRGYIPEDEEKEQEPVSRANWITPQKQLSLAKEMAYTKLDSLPDILKESVIDHAIKSASEDSNTFNARLKTIPSLQDLTIKRLLNLSPIMDWYKALNRLNILPKKIPPLPENILHILEGPCPIYGDQKKEDGTNFKVKDTHVLYLIPEELKSLNHFEREISKPYGQTNYFIFRNPLQFHYFRNEDRPEHGDKPFADTHWVLMSKDVLPCSRKKSWETQVDLVDNLAKKAFAKYKIPSLQEAFAVMLLHKVATGESLYQKGDCENGVRWTYTRVNETAKHPPRTGVWADDTRVNETAKNSHMIVGASFPNGVSVNSDYGRNDEHYGVAALRRF